MKVEGRNLFSTTKVLVLIPETEAESKLVDEYLGKEIPTLVVGKVDLADGYGTHYLALQSGPSLCDVVMHAPNWKRALENEARIASLHGSQADNYYYQHELQLLDQVIALFQSAFQEGD